MIDKVFKLAHSLFFVVFELPIKISKGILHGIFRMGSFLPVTALVIIVDWLAALALFIANIYTMLTQGTTNTVTGAVFSGLFSSTTYTGTDAIAQQMDSTFVNLSPFLWLNNFLNFIMDPDMAAKILNYPIGFIQYIYANFGTEYMTVRVIMIVILAIFSISAILILLWLTAVSLLWKPVLFAVLVDLFIKVLCIILGIDGVRLGGVGESDSSESYT